MQFCCPGLLINSGQPGQSHGYDGHSYDIYDIYDPLLPHALGRALATGAPLRCTTVPSEPQQPQNLHFCQVQFTVNVGICSFSSVFAQKMLGRAKLLPGTKVFHTQYQLLGTALHLQIYFPVNVHCHLASSVVPTMCSGKSCSAKPSALRYR